MQQIESLRYDAISVPNRSESAGPLSGMLPTLRHRGRELCVR